MTDTSPGPTHYAVIGHPVSHSLSPRIHAEFAAQTNQSITYTAIDVGPHELMGRLDALMEEGVHGLNVTVPLKSNTAKSCASLSARAKRAGAVNTLLSRDGDWHGDTTDGDGLITDLNQLGLDLRGQSILLMGAGGSAWSILGALLDAKPRDIVVANRTVSTGRLLSRHFMRYGTVSACGLDRVPNRRYGLVINATSASLQHSRPAIPPGNVRGAHCYDLMYAPGGTPFTDWCFDNGAKSAHTGIGMLVEQAALSFELWRGVRPDTAPVRSRLRTELGFKA
ncbi:MAG: shikimate dehydrogenase [Pseudomonadota bacterium]